MHWRRRMCRNQFILLIFIFVIGLWFFVKSRSITIVDASDRKNKDEIMSEIKDEQDLNKEMLNEIDRLSEFEFQSTVKLDENKRLMEKYRESIQRQKEDEDPFNEKHLVESKYTDFTNFKINFTETKYLPQHLLAAVDKLNRNPTVHNYDKLKRLPKEHAVIIVQVHKRIEYFKELLDSLQRSKGIEEALLVISHDFYCDEMNALIRIIKFCPVIQIFFPFSMQLYPNKFPGPSENDCPRDSKKQNAREIGCINAESPDMYGHYREAPIVMIKHHWWWKINTVMDRLVETKNHNGPFLFIEEDHYVAPSFLHALMILHKFRKSESSCVDSCDILTLGTYNNNQNFEQEGKRVLHGDWVSSQHNMGMSMYRDTWQKIKNCANVFCKYDDYNWDWTLMHISKKCLSRPLSVLLYDVPRVYHVGDCGIHHKKSCNSAKDTLNKIKGVINSNKDYMYVDDIETYRKNGVVSVKANGGWGDSRDHELCLRFVEHENLL